MKVRAINSGDLPKVVEIVLAAMNNDRLWTAFVPPKSAHDITFTEELTKLLKEHMDPAKKHWDIQVVDIAHGNEASEVVAVAVWDISTTRDRSSSESRYLPSCLHLALDNIAHRCPSPCYCRDRLPHQGLYVPC